MNVWDILSHTWRKMAQSCAHAVNLVTLRCVFQVFPSPLSMSHLSHNASDSKTATWTTLGHRYHEKLECNSAAAKVGTDEASAG